VVDEYRTDQFPALLEAYIQGALSTVGMFTSTFEISTLISFFSKIQASTVSICTLQLATEEAKDGFGKSYLGFILMYVE
jgi:hypothetical protein